MSTFGRDLVSNANCGTANPLMQMAQGMTNMNASLQEAKTFEADKSMLGAPRLAPGGGMIHSDMLLNSQAHSQDMHQKFTPFQPQMMQPMMGPPMMHFAPPPTAGPVGVMQHPMIAPPVASAPVNVNDMIGQFTAMELNAKQKEEFERAYQTSHAHGNHDAWTMEFQQKQQMQRMQHAQQGHAMQNFHMRQMGMRPMGMMGMGMMGGMSMNMGGMSMMHQPMTQAAMPPTAAMAQADVTSEKAKEADQATEENATGATDEDYDEAYAEAAQYSHFQEEYDDALNAQAWSQEFESQQSQNVGMGGGLDKDMLDKLMNSDNPKWRNSKFLKFISKIGRGEIEFRDNQAIEKPAGSTTVNQGEQWANEFNASNAFAEQQEQDWATQADENQTDEDQEGQIPSAWQAEYEKYQQNFQQDNKQTEDWFKDYIETNGADEFKDFDWLGALQKAKQELPVKSDPQYTFQSENPYKDSQAAFEEGVKLFNQGHLREAIQAFEAVVTKEPEHADAWCYLGQASAENEEESNAIAAFLKCISIDPYNLKALLSLGVSYTNDLEEHRALNYLKTWLSNNPDYQNSTIAQSSQKVDEYLQFYGADSSNGAVVDATLHDEVTKMFLNAAQTKPDDADVLTVLGVLYHISSDYDKAIDSFRSAVQLRPDDAALWNKLGATLANASQSHDAVHAYQRALQLRPAYVRALSNLAIAYANQGLHEEAIRTYLTTLHYNPEANHVWSYLRISLSHLSREDLVELSHQKNVELFRPYFQF